MFGRDSVIETAIGSLRRTARDVALLETFGPQPNFMVAGLIRVGEAEREQGKLHWGVFRNPLSRRWVDASWMVLNGDSGRIAPGRELFADFTQGQRNLEVFDKLQSGFITTQMDFLNYFGCSGVDRFPMLQAVPNLTTAFGVEDKDLLPRALVIAETFFHGLLRWADGHVGKGWTGMLANATMKDSLLKAWTQTVRRASLKNKMGALATMVRTPWEQLEPFEKRRLQRAGVDECTWRIWGAATPYDVQGAEFLTTQDIREIDQQSVKDEELRRLFADKESAQRNIDKAARALVSFLADESAFASLNPDLLSRGQAAFVPKRGAVIHEARRSFKLFKSFMVDSTRKHLERASDAGKARGYASSIQYAATVITISTFAGAVVAQLRRLLAGEDPQEDMSCADFWKKSLTIGGCAGFLTDFIVSGLYGGNNYDSPDFLKVFAPDPGADVDASGDGKPSGNQSLKGEASKADHEGRPFVRSYMNFVNFWYLKTVIDEAVYNDLMEAASPGYLSRVQQRELKKKIIDRSL